MSESDRQPSWIFPVVERLNSRPLPLIIPVAPGFEMEQLGIDAEQGTAAAIGLGSQLLGSFGEVLAELTGPVIPNMADPLRWQVDNGGELDRILRDFLTPASQHPTLIWTHGFCWTDRCIALDTTAAVIEKEMLPHMQYHGHGILELRFRNYNPSRRALKNKYKKYIKSEIVYINTKKIRWAYPEGLSELDPHFVRYGENSRIFGKDIVSSFHRERIGPAIIRDKKNKWPHLSRLVLKHESILNTSNFPFVEDKTFSLWRRGDDGEPFITPSRSSIMLPGVRPVDGSGIIDAQILKLQRIYLDKSSYNLSDINVDELTVYFDRDTSGVVWIGVTRDLFDQSARDARGRSFLRDNLAPYL